MEEDLAVPFPRLEVVEFTEWVERILRAEDIWFCIRDCVEDRNVLWLFRVRFAE